MKCAHCGDDGAEHKWDMTLCADGKQPREPHLCDGCDLALNALLLSWFNVPDASKKIKAYRDS